jgi:hypothetical protein
MRIKKILTCKNICAPSDMYPNGFSIDFYDDTFNQYFVEYPKLKRTTFDFKENVKYELTFSKKEIKGFLDSISYKMTNIKVLKEIT